MINDKTTTNQASGFQAFLLAAGTALGAGLFALHLGGCAAGNASGGMAMETSPSDTTMTDQAQTMSEMAYADEQVAPAWSSPAYRDGWYEDIDSGSQATLVANTEPEYTAATGTGYVDSESDSAMRASMFAAFGPAEQMAPSHEGDASIAQVSFTEVGADFDPDIDGTGTFVVYASTQHNRKADIYRKAVGGRTKTQLTNDESQNVMPEISPDGTRIAFASDRNGNWDVYVMSVDGGPAMQVTFDAEHEMHPTWSPDGKSVAYCRYDNRSSQWAIWYARVDSPGVRAFVCEGMFPRWSPDTEADRILFQCSRKRGERLFGVWTIELRNGEGCNPTELLSAGNAAIMHPSWSPDGSQVVFTTVMNPDSVTDGMPDQADIWTVNLDGTQRVALTSGGFRNMRPSWSSGGQVFFTSNRGGVDNIWSVNAQMPYSAVQDGGSIAAAGNSDQGE